jgi:hypothetical protein
MAALGVGPVHKFISKAFISVLTHLFLFGQMNAFGVVRFVLFQSPSNGSRETLTPDWLSSGNFRSRTAVAIRPRVCQGFRPDRAGQPASAMTLSFEARQRSILGPVPTIEVAKQENRKCARCAK